MQNNLPRKTIYRGCQCDFVKHQSRKGKLQSLVLENLKPGERYDIYRSQRYLLEILLVIGRAVFGNKRYVEFDYINNGRTYSIEYLKLFQAVCSEIDVVGKALAKELYNSFAATKNTGINEWWFNITTNDSTTLERSIFFGERELQPWKNFIVIRNANEGVKKYVLGDKAKTPSWWNDYNSVKHNRTGRFEKHSLNYSKANLRNLVYAFAALFSLEIKLLETMRKDENDMVSTSMESRVFTEEVSFYTYLLRV